LTDLEEMALGSRPDNTQSDGDGYADGDEFWNRGTSPTLEGLFISEYAEGSSFNKYIEIYNGGSTPANLDAYAWVKCQNGCESGNDLESFNFTAGTMLEPGELWVVSSPSADADILAAADETQSGANWNGDDAVGILHQPSNTLIDMIGVIGSDPGSSWPAGGVSDATRNHTMVRNCDVLEGNADGWTSTSAEQWTILPEDDVTDLGSHCE
ncbi:MAG: lamin tail domain-containing protein, partial [Myxococcota bacterium]